MGFKRHQYGAERRYLAIFQTLAGEEMTELAEKRDSQTAVSATWIGEGSVRLAPFFFFFLNQRLNLPS